MVVSLVKSRHGWGCWAEAWRVHEFVECEWWCRRGCGRGQGLFCGVKMLCCQCWRGFGHGAEAAGSAWAKRVADRVPRLGVECHAYSTPRRGWFCLQGGLGLKADV
ncbi:hypothetical protein PIB30_064559 [Stylosanthes scabra]|uniref:Uncharacterized protein n=1 Tax=Stylosanthes scabra TaxID=79078 RepID=A0ABU6QNS3_9FABA|nr:hypothetical protein [Stylosanthes scabra]